ncbi:hypothetical protein V8D89_004876 [Ganoderma adspersum]
MLDVQDAESLGVIQLAQALAATISLHFPAPFPSLVAAPKEVLKPEWYRKLGSANVFAVRTLDRLDAGVPQCLLAAASWCRYGQDLAASPPARS